MNAATKLALAFLAMFVAGVALIVFGLWPHYHVAAVVAGGLGVWFSGRAFAAVWGSRL